jgi:predicted RNase H-like nuclease (RuvC/YqgF family)
VNLEELSAGLIALFTAFATVWTGGLGYVVKKIIDAAKERSKNKKASDCGHEKTHEQLDWLASELKQQRAAEQALVEENAALRAERDALLKKITSLENRNDRLTIALSQKEATEKKKL